MRRRDGAACSRGLPACASLLVPTSCYLSMLISVIHHIHAHAYTHMRTHAHRHINTHICMTRHTMRSLLTSAGVGCWKSLSSSYVGPTSWAHWRFLTAAPCESWPACSSYTSCVLPSWYISCRMRQSECGTALLVPRTLMTPIVHVVCSAFCCPDMPHVGWDRVSEGQRCSYACLWLAGKEGTMNVGLLCSCYAYLWHAFNQDRFHENDEAEWWRQLV